MWRGLCLLLLSCFPVAAQVAPIPTPTQLPGSPFAIKKSWIIGGTGSWDYLTVDPTAERLYIAHSHTVQVVDLASGSIAGEIGSFRNAHAIALDDISQYGYISDGPADAIAVFDRTSLAVQATIPIGCSPRSIAFEPRSKLVFALCGSNGVNPTQPPHAVPRPSASAPRPPRASGQSPGTGNDEDNNFAGISHVIAVDTEKNTAVADISISGDFRFAQADGAGRVYVTVAQAERMEYSNGHTNRYLIPPHIAKFDGPAVAAEVQRLSEHQSDRDSPVSMDWVDDDGRGERAGFSSVPLPSNCKRPQGLAVDSKDFRLFAACEDQQFLVLNANDGHVISTLTTGPGDDVTGYDPERELIYSANGAGYGSLTIIQQDANTDSYAVIQNLPTLARARTLAVDSSTGNVYLVTDYVGVDLTPRGGFAPIKTTPISGSFQVLVVGH